MQKLLSAILFTLLSTTVFAAHCPETNLSGNTFNYAMIMRDASNQYNNVACYYKNSTNPIIITHITNSQGPWSRGSGETPSTCRGAASECQFDRA